MRKLVIAFDGSQYSEGAMAFARQMNYAEKVSLTGLFLPQTIFSNLWSYADAASATAFIPMLESDDAEQINSNIERFERECTKYGIKYTVKKPIKFVSSGEKLDTLDVFYPERMAQRILGMGDITTLVEKAQAQYDEEQAKKLERRIRKNQFDFEDFKQQLEQIKKNGKY